MGLKRAVKIIGITILALFLVLTGIIIILFIFARAADDMALRRYRVEILEQMELPADTVAVEVVSDCGNTGGTGNHTELYVAVLLKTDLSESAFREYYPHALEAEEHGWETWSMGCVGVSFKEQQAEGKYYILEFIESAPWGDLDLRGH